MKWWSDLIGRLTYAFISLLLFLISIGMMAVSVWDIWESLHKPDLLVRSLLDAIGLIVIAIAVFDVSKFLLEEEVLEISLEKSLADQRHTLLKFLVIIAIALSLEGLVFVFDAGKQDIHNLVYPTFLLLAAVFFVIGLGVYQKLTYKEDKADREAEGFKGHKEKK